MPDYGDIGGGLPPDWQVDPNWVPPPHWGYGDVAAAPLPPGAAGPTIDPALAGAAPPTDQPLELGPPPIDSALAGNPDIPAPPPPEQAAGAPAPALPMPYGAEPPTPMPFGPQPPTVSQLPGLTIRPETAADQYLADPLRSPVPGQARAAAEGASVTDLLDQQRAIDTARQTKALADSARAEEENLRQSRANLDAMKAGAAIAQQKSDRIVSDAMEIASRTVDPDRLMSRMSGVQTVGTLIDVAVGGLVAGRTGGPNTGTDRLQKRIDRDIDAQKADIENAKYGITARRGAVAEEYARTGDLYHAAESVRLATYQAAVNKMQADQQNFDPAGSGYVRYGLQIKDMQARQAAAVETQRREIEKESVERLKVIQKNQELADARLQHRQQLGLGYAQLSSAEADRKAARDARAADKAAEASTKEAENVRQFSVSAPRPVLLTDDKGKPVMGPDGKPITTAQKLVNADGKPWLISSPEGTTAMKQKIVAASEIADMIDEVLDIRDKVGGESSLWNSDAKQRLDVLQARLALVRKSGTQGMSSDKDFENLGASIGAKDLSSFRARAAGLKEARDRTIGELNTEMRTSNYTGPKLDFPNKYGQETQNTSAENRLEGVLRAPDETFDEAVRHEIQKRQYAAGKDFGLDLSSPEDKAIVEGATEAVRARYRPDASISQQDEIGRLGTLAAGPVDDAAAAAARQDLQKIAAEAKTAALQQLARATLESALRSPSSEEPSMRVQDVRRAPPAPAPRSTPAPLPIPIPDQLRLP